MKTIEDLKAITVNQYYGLLFETRNNTHKIHLKNKSYAEHIALNEFYSGIIDLADEFIETYQGQYGLIEMDDSKKTEQENSVKCLTEFVEKTVKFNETLKDSHLKNIIDEITSLTYKTLYKLKYLK
jgi:hypothetical protein